MKNARTTSGQGQTSGQKKKGVAAGLDVDWMTAKRSAWCCTVSLQSIEENQGFEKAVEHADKFAKRLEEFCNDRDKKLAFARFALERGEQGEENGYLHLQVYLWYKESSPLGSTVKRFLAKSAGVDSEIPHVEGRIKSHEEAKEYPGREGKSGKVYEVWTFGDDTGVGQGNRAKDLAKQEEEDKVVHQKIKAGCTKEELWDQHFGYMKRYYRGIYEGASVLTHQLWVTEEKQRAFDLERTKLHEFH